MSEEAFERRMQELDDLVDVYAKADSELGYLEEFKKSKLSMLMKTFESKHPTAAAQEREARAHPEYIELLDGIKIANEDAKKSLWKLKNAHKRIDIWQTRQATERAKMSMR